MLKTCTCARPHMYICQCQKLILSKLQLPVREAYCVICVMEQACVLKTEMRGKCRMKTMSVESGAWTSDRLTARRLVIIKRLPLV